MLNRAAHLLLVNLSSGIALMGCATKLDVSWEAEGCQDVDFNDLPESELQVSLEDGALVARRTAVFVASDAVFDPGTSISGTDLRIDEAWLEGDSGETCFVPTVRVENVERGDWTVIWYLDDGTAFDNAKLTVD
jgi:hypothetical protein